MPPATRGKTGAVAATVTRKVIGHAEARHAASGSLFRFSRRRQVPSCVREANSKFVPATPRPERTRSARSRYRGQRSPTSRRQSRSTRRHPTTGRGLVRRVMVRARGKKSAEGKSTDNRPTRHTHYPQRGTGDGSGLGPQHRPPHGSQTAGTPYIAGTAAARSLTGRAAHHFRESRFEPLA